MVIDEKVISNATANFLTLDELVLLYCRYFDYNWNINIAPAYINKLQRLGLINPDGNITTAGEVVLFSCIETEPKVEVKSNKEDSFNEIWLMFPRDDSFRHFPVSRTIRWNKAETKRHYLDALNTHTHQQLVSALQNELKYRTANSTKENLFKYMKGSVNWFKDQAFLNFVDDEETNITDDYGKEVS